MHTKLEKKNMVESNAVFFCKKKQDIFCVLFTSINISFASKF